MYPQKYSGFNDDDSMPDKAKACIMEIMGLDADQCKGLINCIGNGALLDSKTNAALGNLSPYEKFQRTNAQKLQKYWFKLNLDYLTKYSDEWSIRVIENRSREIISGLIDWIANNMFPTRCK